MIIVTAHSNAAVDLLVKELIIDIPKEDLVRITTKFWLMQMSNDIRRYATDADGYMESRRYERIICGTLHKLGSRKVQLPKKATHVFVDEAGQATEPDVLIPWTKFLSTKYSSINFLKIDV